MYSALCTLESYAQLLGGGSALPARDDFSAVSMTAMTRRPLSAVTANGSPRNKNHPAYNDHGLMRIFKVDGTKLTLVTTAKIGTWAQGSVWSNDGKTIIVQATHEKELQVFSFAGKEAKLTGSIKTNGSGVGMRTSMQ